MLARLTTERRRSLINSMVVSFTSRRPDTYAMQERENVPAMAISSTGPNSQIASPGIRYQVLQTDRDGLSPVNISYRGDDTEAIGQESTFRRKAGSEGTGVKHSKQNDKKKSHHVPIVCADTSLAIKRPFFLSACLSSCEENESVYGEIAGLVVSTNQKTAPRLSPDGQDASHMSAERTNSRQG